MIKISLFIGLSLVFAYAALAKEIIYGPVTNKPMPRYVSMKASEGYARRGPSQTHRIDWVFKHQNLPLMITNEYEHWRRVQDSEGQGGWMHFRLLSGVRTITVTTPLAPIHRRPNPDSSIIAKAESGVIAKLGDCTEKWCKITVKPTKGWIEKSHIWGVFDDEIRN